ncbi:threonine synthase [Alicyclobacillus sp. SO9]|uniref:threonine synthase n=1 Tax=Alicyclobacillus sp. SO9 TaxID=2665646 RepID=UPI0018E83D7B|nr:threonine synthase [Alicyclobacillus sp. SO9]QQE77667.1 threonine synthase [Alicyclobacillus sp. SO9]
MTVASSNPKNAWPGLLHKYAEWLPINESTPRLTLCEGNTPLIPSEVIGPQVGARLYFKFEGANPTGSFKDRGMVLAVAKAVEEGSKAVICASTGNTSASAAAYAVRAGVKAVVIIPEGKIALGKLAQAKMYGAEIVSIRGNFDEALEMVRSLSELLPLTVVNSINPYRLQGQQTAAFEVCDALGHAPDKLCIPVGNAGNISAYWMGFSHYHESGKTDSRPRMFGFEAEGAAALVYGHKIDNPETFATAIRIGNPASGDLALAAAKESKGEIQAVSDEQLAEAYTLLAQEGIFAEPGSAASVAGLLQLSRQGKVVEGEEIVCVLTGNGLKDPDSAIRLSRGNPHSVDADTEEVRQLLEQWL